jgi:hypothetical protein
MHSEYEIRLLAEQSSSELIAEAERLNRRHDARSRHRRKYLRSLLTHFRRPGSDQVVVDLRGSLSPDSAPRSALATDVSERHLDLTREGS